MLTTHISPVWTKVAVFENPEAAQALADAVSRLGYPVRVYDERRLQRLWFLATPHAGLHVQVEADDLRAVREAMAGNPEFAALLNRAVRCPSCSSTRVHYPQMTRKNMLPTLVAHAMVLVGLLRHEYYCEDCHFTWTRGRDRGKGKGKSGDVPMFATGPQPTPKDASRN